MAGNRTFLLGVDRGGVLQAAAHERGCRRRVLDCKRDMPRQFKIVVEKHSDGYVAYPLGMKGTVVSEGESYEDALANIKSAILFHLETFGDEDFSDESPLIEAFIAEATIAA